MLSDLFVNVKNTQMKQKIKEIIEDIRDTVEWIINGCPKPAPIPVKEDNYEKGKRRR